MYKIILLLLFSGQISAQINYLVDTIIKTDSERYPVSAGEIFRYHYFVTDEDRSRSKNYFFDNKYEPFRRITGRGTNNELYEIEELLQIKCDEYYDFIFPFAFYKLRYDRLFEHGLLIENKFGTIGGFGKVLSIVLNFYHNERAVHYINLDTPEISGSQLKTLKESTPFDRIELIIQNRWKDTLRMNFILSEY